MLRIAKWQDFQGYTKTGPKWIKLYAGLIDKPEWMRLPLVSKALLPVLWIAASRAGSAGELPEDTDIIAALCHMKESEVAEGLPSLISAGFVECEGFVASAAKVVSQAPREECRTSREEERRGEERREEKIEGDARAREPVCFIDEKASAEIDAIRDEHSAEEKRLTANLLAIRESGEDIQSVLDSVAEKGRKPYSAYHWERTGRSAVPETAGGVTVLRLLNAALEARQRAQAAPYISDANRQQMESLKRVGDAIRARQAAEGRKEITAA